MPTYVYECTKCDGSKVEIHCSVAKMKKWIKCPACGKRAKQVIEAPAIASGMVARSKKAVARAARPQPVPPARVGLSDGRQSEFMRRKSARITCDREDIV